MRFTIVVLALASSSSPIAFAQPSQATAQCVALANQDKFAEAEPFCAKAAEEPGKDGQVLYGNFLLRKGDFGAAIAQFTEVLRGVDHAKATEAEYKALRSRALLRFYVHSPDADADATDALKLHPDDVELLESAAQRSVSEKKQLEYANRLVSMDPKSANYLVLRSFALTSQHRAEEALAAAENALKLDPKSASALSARAYAYGEAGANAKAERDFAAVVHKVPNEAEPRINHAESLAKLERRSEALEELAAALAIEPDNVRALMDRFAINLALGNGEAALADAQKIKPEDTNYDVEAMKEKADGVVHALAALQPQSVAAMDRDRSIFIGAIERHMHRTCGYFDVDANPDNDALTEYRDCLDKWHAADNRFELEATLGPEVIEAADRLNAIAKWMDEAKDLACSKMPKKSRCVDDKLLAHATAALDVNNDPKAIAGNAEFDRLNRGVAAYNSHARRQNALSTTATVFGEIAKGLGSQ